MPPRPRIVLPTVILAQFAGTSLWFAGNAVLGDLQRDHGLPVTALAPMTSAVQLGFIVGTLAYAALTVADRFSPSRVFLFSALAGALFNAGVGTLAQDYPTILALRFATGFFLAGIYPVGMKIAADWYEAGLGRALGFLVGALVLGTALPHLLRFAAGGLSPTVVLLATSTLAAAGGAAVALLVPDGPFRRRGRGFRPSAIVRTFRLPDFRASALGYFGHMWELYAFWAFVPVLVDAGFGDLPPERVSLLSFCIIAAGAVGCVAGGFASDRWGSAAVARIALAVSGGSCLVAPLLLPAAGAPWAVLLVVWGVAVVADSPQFSTLVARAAPAELRGSALTIVNSLGFALTIPAIAALSALASLVGVGAGLPLLATGPLLGLVAIRRLVR